jgi:prepilin-type N-terminal cleavage/methylation domain-containing protein
MKRSGFTVTELLFVLLLLGVFALMGTRLFYASVGIMQGAAKITESAMRFDSAMAAMQHDVFLSDSTEMLSPNSLTVHRTNGSPVQWQASGTDIERTAGDAQQHWNIGQKIDIRLQGQIVLIHPAIGGELAMASALEITK